MKISMTKKKQLPPSSHVFKAVWPILEGPGFEPRSDEDLIRLAAADLKNVALRHRAHITGPGKGYIAPGRGVPGALGIAKVVVIEAPADPIQRAYHR